MSGIKLRVGRIEQDEIERAGPDARHHARQARVDGSLQDPLQQDEPTRDEKRFSERPARHRLARFEDDEVRDDWSDAAGACHGDTGENIHYAAFFVDMRK